LTNDDGIVRVKANQLDKYLGQSSLGKLSVRTRRYTQTHADRLHGPVKWTVMKSN